MNRFKFLLYAVGVCLAVGTLVGANRLTHGDTATPGGAGAKAPAPKATEGLVAKGTVVAETDPLAYLLPPHLPSGKVREILVRNGQIVKKGDLLARFDDWNYQADLKKAEAVHKGLIGQHGVVVAKQLQHKDLVEKAKLAVKNATQSRDKAKEGLAAVRKGLELRMRIEVRSNLERTLRDEPDFLKAESLLEMAENQILEKNLDLEQANKEPLTPALETAYWQVQAALAEVDRAKQAIALCEVKAEVGGVVERVSATPGQVMYPQSRLPLFYLIPEGTRLVRAEVVPEFAFKIQNKDGTKVIISDDSNPNLTYDGIVEQTGTAFLPKTNGVDLVTGKPSNVLEVQIRVTDPAPAGKPALRVGQPVRVTFP